MVGKAETTAFTHPDIVPILSRMDAVAVQTPLAQIGGIVIPGLVDRCRTGRRGGRFPAYVSGF